MTEAAASAAAGAVEVAHKAHDAASFVSGMPWAIGVLGAAALFVFAPPGKPAPKNATPEQLAEHRHEAMQRGKEVAQRMFLAALSSEFVGTWLVDALDSAFPRLLIEKHPTPILMLTGALGWYFGRGLWLWLERRKNKDLGQQISDAAGTVADVKGKVL